MLQYSCCGPKITHASKSMSAGHRRSVCFMLWLTSANGIYNLPVLCDNDGKLCKEIAGSISLLGNVHGHSCG